MSSRIVVADGDADRVGSDSLDGDTNNEDDEGFSASVAGDCAVPLLFLLSFLLSFVFEFVFELGLVLGDGGVPIVK